VTGVGPDRSMIRRVEASVRARRSWIGLTCCFHGDAEGPATGWACWAATASGAGSGSVVGAAAGAAGCTLARGFLASLGFSGPLVVAALRRGMAVVGGVWEGD
jgi:hypothetical protein